MRRKHSAIEGEILRAAAETFSDRGYQATTLDDIASAARISRATFYSYFPSKDELLRRMYTQVIATTQETVERIASENISAPEKLRRIIRFLVSYIGSHKPLIQVFFSELFSLSSTMTQSVSRANRALWEVIERIVDEGIQAGIFISLHPRRFTYLLLGACNWTHRWYRPGGEWTPDTIAEEIIHVLEGGYLQQQPKTASANTEELLLQEVRALREEVKQLQCSLQPSPVKTTQPRKRKSAVAALGTRKRAMTQSAWCLLHASTMLLSFS